jgi:hypothetical protein
MTTRQRAYTKCQHEGCTATDGIEDWTIQGYDPAPVFVFCADHAAEFGFCTSCGAFIGGTEDVFLTGQRGLCFDCFMAIEREIERSCNTDYDDWADYDYYDEVTMQWLPNDL